MVEHPVDTRMLRGTPVIAGLDTMPPGSVFRRPQGLDDHLLVYTTGGQGHIGPEHGKFPQRSGHLLLIDPQLPVDQDVADDRSWGRIWVIFQPRDHWYAWMDWPQLAGGYRMLDLQGSLVDEEVRAQLTRMHQFAVSGVPTGHALAMNALEAAMILANELTPWAEGTRQDPRLETALVFIGRQLHNRLTLQAIAHAAHVSAPHLSRLFRARMGRSVMSFVEHQRITRACQLLEMTSQPIAGIASDVGFEDPFYFSTRFRRMLKVSPGAYRILKTERASGR